MKSEMMLKIEERINNFEKNELWDNEVFDNPETIPLQPNKIDYLSEKALTRFWNKVSNRLAIKYFDKEIKKKNLVIKEIKGIENYNVVEGGAIITCNHVSIYDHYVVYKAIKPYLPKGKQLYKVIREGNYTNFKGIFGFFFKHCNTLPLSSIQETMKKFLKSFSTLLNRGEKILIYPEQALWKNYKKPRPCKSGAFNLAARNKAPIIPMFLTMEDTDRVDADGFPYQAYTLWIEPAIYPNLELSAKENVAIMQQTNYDVWKKIYENAYGIKLEYIKE